MSNIQTTFSINDLENLSGIKTHTIRIWEKRYNLLVPERFETSGIRYYNISQVQKLLNTTLLYNNGLKISKIAKLTEEELVEKCQEIVETPNAHDYILKKMSVACLDYDLKTLEDCYADLLDKYPFEEAFTKYLIPFLNQIGLSWQSNAITPAHEHFASGIIKRKIQRNIDEMIVNNNLDDSTVYILFLPDSEDHELGLLFAHYQLLNKGKKSIYLGPSVPLEALTSLTSRFDKVKFISSFSVYPHKDNILKYLEDYNKQIGEPFFISGRNTIDLEIPKEWPHIKALKSHSDLTNNL